jgi:hypothetical protein
MPCQIRALGVPTRSHENPQATRPTTRPLRGDVGAWRRRGGWSWPIRGRERCFPGLDGRRAPPETTVSLPGCPPVVAALGEPGAGKASDD